MKKRILSGFLIFCLLCGFSACSKPTEIGEASVSESPSEEYSYSVSISSSVEIPDYSQYIGRVTDWLFANSETYSCDTVWAATAIEISGKKGTLEASQLLPVKFASDVDSENATEVAKLAISAIMMGDDPKEYIIGLDLVEKILSYHHVGGWFSAQQTQEVLTDPATDTEEDNAEPTVVAPDNSLEDTLWCMIALNMINKEYDRTGCGTWLYSQMHKDGSMAFDSALGEVEATALAVLALSRNTDEDGKMVYNGCMEYLISACNDDGFFTDAREDARENPADQAMAIAAIISSGENIYGQRWMKNGKSVVDGLLSFQHEDGSFSVSDEDDCTASAKSLFALICAQADSMIWSNYAMADIEPESTAE